MLDVIFGVIAVILGITCVRFYGKNRELKTEMQYMSNESDKLAMVADMQKTITDMQKQNTADRFQVLAEDTLKKQSDEFKESTAMPMAKTMEDLLRMISALREQNADNTATFHASMVAMKETNDKLMSDTKAISGILSNAQKRGKFAELGLERVFEMSGLIKNVNYSIQKSNESGRPDFVVHLPENRTIIVDSKAPLDALWRSYDTNDEAEKASELEAHVMAIRSHINALSKRGYAKEHETLDYVIMVIPEYSLLPAIDRDSHITEYALKSKVVLVTPAALMIVLNVIRIMWKQNELTKSVKIIGDLSTDLYDKLGNFAASYEKVRKGLDVAVSAYNTSVGSWIRYLMPAAARLKESGVNMADIEQIEEIDSMVRRIPLEDKSGKHDA